ncbi:FAD-dependent oxidoreductase [Corynebacterium sp. USCH3]|uniref:FAD-dependent oxidoreductase n=1 Tax=Corynebacterium sp. USCH3 TaxID=3024840 RepID=UPI0030A1BF0F
MHRPHRTDLQADVLVVGAGLTGSAVAWKLADRGRSVIVVDRDVPASAHGSSHGSARIFRYPYPDPLYTRLVVDAAAQWDDLERRTGRPLVTRCGGIDYGDVRDPVHLAGVLRDAGVDHELMSPTTAQDRWPFLSFRGPHESTPVLWHPGAGVIDAEATVRAQQAEAVRGGALFLDHWTVSSVRRLGGTRTGYSVISASGSTIEAGQVVIAAGGWVNDVLATTELPDSFLRRLPTAQVSEEYAYHFPYRDSAADWPTTINLTRELQVYSLPGGRDAGGRGQKVAVYNAGRKMNSAAHQDGVVDATNRTLVVDYVRRNMPGLVPEPYAETTCLFTTLPNDDFLIDGTDGVTVVSPCSGHGAKFAPLIGDLVAGLVTGRSTVPEQFRAPANPGHRRETHHPVPDDRV